MWHPIADRPGPSSSRLRRRPQRRPRGSGGRGGVDGRARGHLWRADEAQGASRRGGADPGGVRRAESEGSRRLIQPAHIRALRAHRSAHRGVEHGHRTPTAARRCVRRANFTGAIIEELNRLRKNDLIRLLDVLVVKKDQDGTVTAAQVSDLSVGEAEDVGMSAAGPCDRDRRGVRAGARSSQGSHHPCPRATISGSPRGDSPFPGDGNGSPFLTPENTTVKRDLA